MHARVDALVARLPCKEDDAVRGEAEGGPLAGCAECRMAVGTVGAWVSAPVLDEEAVARAARWPRLRGRAKHGVKLRQHEASDLSMWQFGHALSARARNEADHRVRRRRVLAHELGGGREPHLRQEGIGAHGVVKVERPEAARQPHDHLERRAHSKLTDGGRVHCRQRRLEVHFPTLQGAQRNGDDHRAGPYSPPAAANDLHAARVVCGCSPPGIHADTLDGPVGSERQAACERLHGVLQAGSAHHDVLLAVAPAPLLVHDLMQAHITHVCAVIVAKDSIGEVKHARAQAAARKILQERLLGHLGSVERLELLEAFVHQCNVVQVVSRLSRQQRGLLSKEIVVGPLKLNEADVRTADEPIPHQIEQSVIFLAMDELGAKLEGPLCESGIVKHATANFI